MLSREEVRNKFVGWGIENPTDEQISDYLAQIGKEIKSSEDKAQKYKDDALRVKELQKQLDNMNNEKLTDAERSQKAVDEAQKRVAELEKTVSSMKLLNSLAEIGINGDDATAVVNEDGSLNTIKLGEIIATREKNAVAVFQKKALDETPTPNGAKADPEPDAPYKEIADRVAASKKAETEAVSIIDSYK